MENLVKSTLENYGVYVIGLGNIPYAIQLWFYIVMEGFVMGLTMGWLTKKIHRELDYSSVGLDFVGSGGQGGALIDPRKTWSRSLKH